MRIKLGRKAMKRLVQSKRTKATQKMLTHFTLNAALPAMDMATDLITGIKFINMGHLFWGMSSILCNVHVLPICDEVCDADIGEHQRNCKKKALRQPRPRNPL